MEAHATTLYPRTIGRVQFMMEGKDHNYLIVETIGMILLTMR